MKLKLLTAVFPLFLFFNATTAWADNYLDTRQMFKEAGISDMFNSAHAYALFPTIGKGGIIVGGAYGKGRVYKEGVYIDDSDEYRFSTWWSRL